MKLLSLILAACALGASTLHAQTMSVPAMTSATLPDGIVTRSGVYDSTFEAWQAFDNSDTSMWISAVNGTPAWIGYEYSNGPRRIVSYAIKYVNGSIVTRAPKDWALQAWNGSAWVVVDTRTNQTNWAGWEERTYSVASPGYYTKYRLYITDDNDSRTGVVVISMGKLSLFAETSVPAMTGPGTPSGAVTRSGVYSSSYEGWQAFDRNDTSMWISEVNVTPAWIGYEYSTGVKRVVSYAIKYVNGSIVTRAPKNWTLQAWTGSTWVTIDYRTNQTNWLGFEERSYTVAFPGYYSKYRLNITDDNDTRAGVVVISMGKLSFVTDGSTGPLWTTPAYEPAYWNDGGIIQYNNNCYNYSNNRRTDTFAQPGDAGGDPIYSLTAAEVSAGAIADGLVPTTATGVDPSGKSKIALVIWPGSDYHWYRLDRDGRWSHKPGGGRATNLDNSGNIITSPETANRGPYTQFVGYFFTPSDAEQGQGHANIE